MNKQFSVHSDASDVGLGAVLNQIGEDGEEHPVAYASRKLKPRETRYSTIEKECLAAVRALKLFEHCLYGQPFTIHLSDGSPTSDLAEEYEKFQPTTDQVGSMSTTVQV